MSQNIYITKTLVANDNQSELDFVLQDEFNFSYDTHEQLVEIEKGKSYSAHSTPIKIDDMIKILQGLKDRGATHVQIEDHCDHIGYDISGFEIRLSTQEEIDELNDLFFGDFYSVPHFRRHIELLREIVLELCPDGCNECGMQ